MQMFCEMMYKYHVEFVPVFEMIVLCLHVWIW
jgi:hypothetical protein